jgi:hypothetical protein
MANFDAVWERVRRHAGEEFRTIGGLPFAYEVRGSQVHVTRDGREVNRALSRGNFEQAMRLMPASTMALS